MRYCGFRPAASRMNAVLNRRSAIWSLQRPYSAGPASHACYQVLRPSRRFPRAILA